MWMKTLMPMAATLIICLAAAACAGLPSATKSASGRTTQTQTYNDGLAIWSAGPDNRSP
jgi:ABC-type glycerol-3-phosphate transport system substrate-binding protein